MKDTELLNRVMNAIIRIMQNDPKIHKFFLEYLGRYLSDDDIISLNRIINGPKKTIQKPLTKTSQIYKSGDQPILLGRKFNVIKDTPYTILRIDEKKYTKKELLKIVKERITFIKENEIYNQSSREKIDIVLDAYNEIIKTYKKQKKYQ